MEENAKIHWHFLKCRLKKNSQTSVSWIMHIQSTLLHVYKNKKTK